MPFAKGRSGNPAGRRKGEKSLATKHRAAMRVLNESAPALIELGVARALAGNDQALNGCLQLLAANSVSEPTQKPEAKPASNSQRQVLADGSAAMASTACEAR